MIKVKSVLVHSSVSYWKHFYAESVDFALKHLKDGDHVFFTRCGNSFPSCPANPHHDLRICKESSDHEDYVLDIIRHKYPDTFHTISIVALDHDYTNSEFDQGLISLNSAQTVRDLQQIFYKSLPIGRLISSQIADITKDAFFSLDENHELINNLYFHSCKFYDQIIGLINHFNISNSYVWNGRRPATGSVVYAANAMGISCTTHIVGSRLGDIFTSPGYYVHCLNSHHKYIEDLYHKHFYKRQPSLLIEESSKYFFQFQRDPTKSTGFGQWNFANQFKHTYFPKGKKPILSIFTSTLWEKIGMLDYLPFFYTDEFVGLEQILNIDELYDKYHIVVRLHPFSFNVGQYESSRIKDIVKRFDDSVEFIQPSSCISSYSLLDASDIVVTFGSTIGIEAVYSKKPSILLGPALYQSLDCNIIPASHEQLKIILLDMIFDVSNLSLSYYKSLAFGLYESRRTHLSFTCLKLRDNIFYFDGVPVNPVPSLWARIFRKIKHIVDIIRSNFRTL